MIDIRYLPGKKVTIKGHAGYAEKGKDIVCAAISTLYCTMILDKGIVGIQHEDEMQACLSDPKSEETFKAFAVGMQKVAEKYPAYCAFRREKYDLDQK